MIEGSVFFSMLAYVLQGRTPVLIGCVVKQPIKCSVRQSAGAGVQRVVQPLSFRVCQPLSFRSVLVYFPTQAPHIHTNTDILFLRAPWTKRCVWSEVALEVDTLKLLHMSEYVSSSNSAQPSEVE